MEPAKVADAIASAVAKGADMQLVNDGVLEPRESAGEAIGTVLLLEICFGEFVLGRGILVEPKGVPEGRRAQ